MEEETCTEKDRLETLLEDCNLSELVEAVKNVCPFFKAKNQELTPVYLQFHELCKVSLLTGLQLRLDKRNWLARGRRNPAMLTAPLQAELTGGKVQPEMKFLIHKI
ncbi:hypothetical protein AKJ57_04960 [candidate division MSBL1 archaeon SCGC-AAA259A05]|uniref:Uncharacterized protein n=2 Tax=candidate division MSBL1 TaxID=215777 RepID=A0A133U6A5_9EURY|nr:hypothetical protein AKJ57_04960 [candidate division MSBL1 archaeon SCGC-AAA259A05]